MKRIIVTSTEELFQIMEELDYNLKECQEFFNWYCNNNMILISKYELIRTLKNFQKNEDSGNVLNHLVNPN
ncbi:MAG: hypothetical protein KDC64_06700 [Aequorivita sp.]|nr:hypothetical protein [Aequorivita sp.]